MLSRIRDPLIAKMRSSLSMRTRRKIKMGLVDFRRHMAGDRPLPNLLVIGGQRCGTSSLFKYLGQHPEVQASIRKEIEYFTLNHHRGERWYRAHFPAASRSDGTHVCFEATPNYLLDPRCAERAAELVPTARIVVLLRDPVARAFSQYQHNVKLGNEPLRFEEALAREEERMASAISRLERDPDLPLPLELRRYSYFTRGLYARQLIPWLARFRRDRLLVLSSEDLFHHPEATFRQIIGFLGIRDWTPASFANHSHPRGTMSSPPGFPRSLQNELSNRYREPNQELVALLGRDFGWSLDPARSRLPESVRRPATGKPENGPLVRPRPGSATVGARMSG